MPQNLKTRPSWPMRATTTLLLLLCAGVSFAQERREDTEARKVDEYGKVGHCDLTARLDNFAIELQNAPSAKGYVVAYDPTVKKYNYAERQLRLARHYLIHVRGINPERIITVASGSKGEAEGATELWFVPERAAPPVEPSTPDKFSAQDFSGKFDSYSTDMRIFREMVEMGYPDEDISHAQFSEKLKGQPGSVGYLVIKTPADTPPGAWRSLARREEQILRKEYQVEAGRLKSIDGGPSDGEFAEIELWILPAAAPPPASSPRKVESNLAKAVKLYRFETYGESDGEAASWMIENLAAFLREHPKASAHLIAREPKPFEAGTSEGNEVAEAPAQENLAEPEGQDSQADEGSETDEQEPETASMKETAEGWRRKLAANYGVDANRIVILEGKQMEWGGRLNVWLVPEKTARPDPLARDEDDPDEEPQ